MRGLWQYCHHLISVKLHFAEPIFQVTSWIMTLDEFDNLCGKQGESDIYSALVKLVWRNQVSTKILFKFKEFEHLCGPYAGRP